MSTLPDIVPLRACGDCKFSSFELLQRNVLQKVLLCKHGPPVPILIPSGPSSANLQPLWPAVAPTHWCHRFERSLTDESNTN